MNFCPFKSLESYRLAMFSKVELVKTKLKSRFCLNFGGTLQLVLHYAISSEDLKSLRFEP